MPCREKGRIAVKKQRKLDCFGAKRLSDLLALPGVGLVLLGGYLWQWSGKGGWIALVAAGTALLIAGLIVGWLGIVCPRCGAPLDQVPRLPRRMPAHCPRCGEAVQKEQ